MNLEKRILDVTYEVGCCHLSSTLSAAPILLEIYELKGKDEVFILSAGHSALALYCLLERYGKDAAELYRKHGVHPKRDLEDGIYCTTGSLGCGLPIAIGHALGRNDTVWVMISDGECAEGSVWESLRFINEHVPNIEVYVNMNGLSAIEEVDTEYLANRLRVFLPRIRIRYSKPYEWSFAKGLKTHYCTLTKENHEEAIRSVDRETCPQAYC